MIITTDWAVMSAKEQIIIVGLLAADECDIVAIDDHSFCSDAEENGLIEQTGGASLMQPRVAKERETKEK